MPVPELLLSEIDSVLDGFDALPPLSSEVIVIAEEQRPAVVEAGEDVNPSFAAGPVKFAVTDAVLPLAAVTVQGFIAFPVVHVVVAFPENVHDVNTKPVPGVAVMNMVLPAAIEVFEHPFVVVQGAM